LPRAVVITVAGLGGIVAGYRGKHLFRNFMWSLVCFEHCGDDKMVF
jgi:hypothetical protein